MADNDFANIIFEFNFVTSILFTSIGLIGNGLVIYIISRPKFRSIAMFRYLIVATLVDTINLSTMWPALYINELNIMSVELSCKFFFYAIYVFYQFSPWLLVLSTLERYLSVKFQNRFKFRNEFKYQLLIMIIIFLMTVILDFPVFYYYSLHHNSTYCHVDYSIGIYIDVFNSLVAAIIPFFVMILLNGLIVHLLITQKQKLHRKEFKKEIQYFKTMLAVSSYFLLCNLPFCILIVINDAMVIKYTHTLHFFVLNALTFLYCAFNFLVYMLSNKLFRSYFWSMFCCKK